MKSWLYDISKSVFHKIFVFWRNWFVSLIQQKIDSVWYYSLGVFLACHINLDLCVLVPRVEKSDTSSQTPPYLCLGQGTLLRKHHCLHNSLAFCFEIQDVLCNLRLMRQQKILSSLLLPGQEPSPEYPLSENIFENKPLNPTLDDEGAQFMSFPHPHRNTLSWPSVSWTATLTGYTPPLNAWSWTYRSFPTLPPIL